MSMPADWMFVLRLLGATALAGTIGAERELSDQPAGFRTHALVGLGAAVFAIISAYGFDTLVSNGPPSAMRADVTRVVSQIVVGIGFLGGGAIVKYGTSIRGLTTAATLWITAAVGTAAGLGSWVLAIGATVIALAALIGLRPLRGLLRRHATVSGELRVETRRDANVEDLLGTLEAAGATLARVRIDDRDGARGLVVDLKLPPAMTSAEITQRIASDPRVETVDWDSS
jgi:putative Mg2+ transporter-C (MgtC) family protein